MGEDIIIKSEEEEKLRQTLSEGKDAFSVRLTRFLELPDLSRAPGSPLQEVVKRASGVESLKGFDVIKIPEIVPTEILFDLFNITLTMVMSYAHTILSFGITT